MLRHSEVENLREESTERNMCPVTQILALCFADEVFKDLSSPADLARIRFRLGRESVRLLVREDKLRLPVGRCRRCALLLSTRVPALQEGQG